MLAFVIHFVYSDEQFVDILIPVNGDSYRLHALKSTLWQEPQNLHQNNL